MRAPFFALAALLAAAHALPFAVRHSKDAPSIPELLSSTPDFSVLAQLVDRAGMAGAFSGGQHFTVFAPTNAAFAATAADFGYAGSPTDTDAVAEYITTGAAGVAKALGLEEKAALGGLLGYHVAPKHLNAKDVLKVTKIETLAPNAVITRGGKGKDPNQLVDLAPDLTDPKLISDVQDVAVQNGVVHGIDRMLQRGPMTKERFQQAYKMASGMKDGKKTSTTDDGDDTASASGSPDPEAETSAEESPDASVSPDPRAEPTKEDDGSACFPAAAVVHMADGSDKPMAQLVAGDRIRHSTASSRESHSPVFLFSHRLPTGLREFLRIESDAGHVLTITPKHYVYANGRMATADSVRVGHVLNTLDGPATVSAVRRVKAEGLFAPHTMHGDIVVDRVRASTYTQAVHPTVAHYALAPLRAAARMGLVEPLGALLYEGADRFAPWLPKGPVAV